MLGGFTCPYCFTVNACNCQACAPHIKEGEYVNEWTEDGEFLICGKCKQVYSPDASLDAEYKGTVGPGKATSDYIDGKVVEQLRAFAKWTADEGYVLNKDDQWYKSAKYPRVYLKNEELIELYYKVKDK